jgi:hypothetical protein
MRKAEWRSGVSENGNFESLVTFGRIWTFEEALEMVGKQSTDAG